MPIAVHQDRSLDGEGLISWKASLSVLMVVMPVEPLSAKLPCGTKITDADNVRIVAHIEGQPLDW